MKSSYYVEVATAVPNTSTDKNLANGLFFLELLSVVEPRVVNWNLVTKGETAVEIHITFALIHLYGNVDEEKKLNATYIISVARKLGCSIFLLPEDIMEVNQKMVLTLTASIMYWSLQKRAEESESSAGANTSVDGEEGSTISRTTSSTISRTASNMTIDDAASDTSLQVEMANASVE
ncbi:hypothetical protein ACLOJK_000706 [Asimina triloba]